MFGELSVFLFCFFFSSFSFFSAGLCWSICCTLSQMFSVRSVVADKASVEEQVREMLQYVLNTSTNVFCQYCPRREVLRRGTVLSSICQASWPSPTTTLDRKKSSKKGIMFGELSVWFFVVVVVVFLPDYVGVFVVQCYKGFLLELS